VVLKLLFDFSLASVRRDSTACRRTQSNDNRTADESLIPVYSLWKMSLGNEENSLENIS